MTATFAAPSVTSPVVSHRYDFVLLYDVSHGNPNGDPDAGNSPRIDPETGHGLVSDVALKRKIRDFVSLAKTDLGGGGPEPGYDIYIKHRGILQTAHGQAYEALGLDPAALKGSDKQEGVDRARAWMCQTYYDIRTFGAVLTLSINCGQVRGPAQITFSRSQDPIACLEQSIVRKAVATEKEADSQIDKHGQVTGTMGRKDIVPYALYRAHGFISPHLASDTGFTDADLALFWQALTQMFEHDHSATRGEMATRKLIVFEHESPLGNAPAHRLFERVKVERVDTTRPPRAFDDYRVVVDGGNLPAGVSLEEKV